MLRPLVPQFGGESILTKVTSARISHTLYSPGAGVGAARLRENSVWVVARFCPLVAVHGKQIGVGATPTVPDGGRDAM